MRAEEKKTPAIVQRFYILCRISKSEREEHITRHDIKSTGTYRLGFSDAASSFSISSLKTTNPSSGRQSKERTSSRLVEISAVLLWV